MSQVTPKSNYSGPVVVDPLTRIEGHLRIEVEVENGSIKNARSCGTLFRGLENILVGRDPRDAQHFTQRTCGVCTYTHALASTRALEDAMGIEIPANATHIRNIMLGMLFAHDHIVHFYHLHALDFVDAAAATKADVKKTAELAKSISKNPTSEKELQEVKDKVTKLVQSGQLGPFSNAYFLGGHPAYYLTPEQNLLAVAHYLEALRIQVKAARAMAIFGSKNPHPQTLIAGGVTCYNSLDKEVLKQFEELYNETLSFIENTLVPDVLLVGGAYKDWTQFGGGAVNYLSFGEFPAPGKERDVNSRWFKPGLVKNRDLSKVYDVDFSKIEEHVRHSWYEGDKARHPYEGETKPKFTKMGDTDRYSWLKAPRYDGMVVETGPLASMVVAYAQGHKEVKEVIDFVLNALGLKPADLFSTLGRTAARASECLIVTRQVRVWFEELKKNLAKGDTKICVNAEVPEKAKGVGIVNAPRGGLSHWLVVEDSVIKNFQLVVPSTWNLGPRDAKGNMSAVEEALIGTPIADPKRPVEILRIVHSFDPCMACAVHVIDNETNTSRDFRIL